MSVCTAIPIARPPDFAARKRHFIFTDDHEQLRESIRNFATKELAPHAEEWEETTFPDSV
ncbi:MAG TPA: acyl-CoA dehydrogenase family protein, partial [Solirubrobacteraceae bacterium]|nr:acyl-CoA dehydrogenase family protein [Solirubrobacteraceae bacterium]